MKKSEAIFGVARLPLDAVAVGGALFLSYWLRLHNINLLTPRQLEPATTLPPLDYYFSAFVLPWIVLFVIIAAFLRLYTLRITMGAWAEIGRVMVATLLWVACITGWYFIVRGQLFYSRALLLHGILFLFLFVTMGRVVLTVIQRMLLEAGWGKIIVVSVGSHAPPPPAKHTLETDRHYLYLGHLPDLESVKRLMRRSPLDLLVQTDPDPKSDATLALIDYCRSLHIGYGFLPPVLADVPHQLQVERLGLLPLIRFQPTPLDGWGRVAKRLFDIAGSFIFIVLLSPLLLLIAFLILLDGGRPVFYRSKRVGQHARKMIHVLKFRSMIQNADKEKEKLLRLNHRRDGPLSSKTPIAKPCGRKRKN